MQFFKLVMVLLLGFVLASCGSRQIESEDIVIQSEEVEIQTKMIEGSVSASGISEDTEPGLSYYTDEDADLLAHRVIYFEYDSSGLNVENKAVVLAHAQNLMNDVSLNVTLEGHADERGTREYNLALAEERAKSVANLIQAVGVDSNRIQIISYGEERPVSLGSDETAWGLNRRVEILFQ